MWFSFLKVASFKKKKKDTETLTFLSATAADTKEGCAFFAQRPSTAAPEKKETKQRVLRQPWQQLGGVNRGYAMRSMQLWCGAGCSKRRSPSLRLSSVSASLLQIRSLLLLDFSIDFCYIMVIFSVRHFHDGKGLKKCKKKYIYMYISSKHIGVENLTFFSKLTHQTDCFQMSWFNYEDAWKKRIQKLRANFFA